MSEIVEIVDISYEGAGVGKLDGQVVFVPKALPGERVEIEILKRSKNFLIGNLKKVLEKSPKRIESSCPYFEVCGGCDFQHASEEYEIELKIDILKNELKKVGYVGEVTFEKSPKRIGYRNKIKFEVKDGKLGYFKSKTHDFFEVKNCPIASEKINNTIPKIAKFLEENRLENLKNVYIKEFQEKLGICFLFDKNAKKSVKNVKNMQIFNDFLIFFAFGDILESDKTQIFPINFSENLIEFDMRAFSQVNSKVAEKLYDYITNSTTGEYVVNAYSGQGLLTLKLAEKSKFAFGIEFQKSSHDKAEKLRLCSSEKDKIENICGKVEDELGGILKRSKVDTIVLDPARAGCDRVVLDEINKSEIGKVIYVSCNFSTLTRDLKVLVEKYAFESVKVFDMFPLTSNMETVVILKKNVEY